MGFSLLKLNWIPNFLSTLRILLAFIFPLVPADLRIPLLGLAFTTEFFDGWLARRFHWTSASGQLLDPIADKLFTLAVGLTFIAANRLSVFQLIMISARDLMAAGGFFFWLFLSRRNATLADFRPQMPGKVTTAFQYLVFLDVAAFARPHEALILFTGFLSIFAAVIYSYNFRLAIR